MKDGTFTADRLLALYGRVAEAEDAIPRLRRFVLDLAVRGKLVEQDPTDEPAAELLKRLGKGLVAAPDMPKNWLSAKLGEVIDLQYGKGLDKKLRLDEGPVPVFGSNGVVGFTEEPRTARPSIIVGRKGSAGALNICDGPSWTTDVAYFVEVPSFLTLRYLFNMLSSLGLDGLGKGVKPGLSRSDAYDLPVSLPPLAEQQRIVAKVDELMALCDRLQAARAGREAARDLLTAATLTRLTAPETDADTFPAHARFALQTLPTLTTRPDQIKTLRQTILNLAARGKLVAQDPSDEPAAELLKRIHSSRKYRRKFAMIDREELENPLPDLPASWAWASVDEIGADDGNAITDGPFGSQLKTADYIETPGYRVVRLQNIASGMFRKEHRSYIDAQRFHRLAKHHVFAGDLVVAGLVDPSVRCCKIPDEIGPALVKADCYRLAVHPWISSCFTMYFLNSPLAQEFAAVHHHGMTLTRIGLGNFRRVPVPLPPLAEQHRIVAKVDALMALCDQLEASLTTATTTRSRLFEALLHEALGGQSEAAA